MLKRKSGRYIMSSYSNIKMKLKEIPITITSIEVHE